MWADGAVVSRHCWCHFQLRWHSRPWVRRIPFVCQTQQTSALIISMPNETLKTSVSCPYYPGPIRHLSLRLTHSRLLQYWKLQLVQLWWRHEVNALVKRAQSLLWPLFSDRSQFPEEGWRLWQPWSCKSHVRRRTQMRCRGQDAFRVLSSPLFAKSAAAGGDWDWKLDRFPERAAPSAARCCTLETGLFLRKELSFTSTPLSTPTCQLQRASPDFSFHCYCSLGPQQILTHPFNPRALCRTSHCSNLAVGHFMEMCTGEHYVTGVWSSFSCPWWVISSWFHLLL